MKLPFPYGLSTISCVLSLLACSNASVPDADDTDDSDAAAPDTKVSAALTTYCDARTKFVARCDGSGELSECARTLTTSCRSHYAVYRDELLSALTTCGFNAECTNDGFTFAEESCIDDAKEQIAPTAAQTQLATDFCAVCGAVAEDTDCLDNFFFVGRRLENGGVTVSGAGTSFSMLTDAEVAKIHASCLPSAAGESCYPDFYDCISGQLTASRGSDDASCSDGSGT